MAALQGCYDAAGFLVRECGADVNARAATEATPHSTSPAMSGSVELLRLLLQEGAEVNAVDRSDFSTPLDRAEDGRNGEVAGALFESMGGSPSAKTPILVWCPAAAPSGVHGEREGPVPRTGTIWGSSTALVSSGTQWHAPFSPYLYAGKPAQASAQATCGSSAET